VYILWGIGAPLFPLSRVVFLPARTESGGKSVAEKRDVLFLSEFSFYLILRGETRFRQIIPLDEFTITVKPRYKEKYIINVV